MPISGQTPLFLITDAKEFALAYQPLLLAELTFGDGAILRLATENLDVNDAGFNYNGNVYHPRILNHDVGAIQAISENGIVQSPQITLVLADADKQLWTQYEYFDGRGFKGAKVILKFVFWDAGTNIFSTDERIVFSGVCNPPNAPDVNTLAVVATNRLNMNRVNLPQGQVSRNCIWNFPVTAAQRLEAVNNEDSLFYECGYSPDISSGVGNNDPLTGQPFTFCPLTWEACIERLGNAGLPDHSNTGTIPVRIERDQSNRATGRFGGIHFDPPASWRGREYLSGQKEEGIDNANEAKFNDYYPLIYGTGVFVEPVVMNVLGDPNFTRMELAITIGQLHDSMDTEGPIQAVLINDFYVPFWKNSGSTGDLRWQWVSLGGRNGSPNRDKLYDGRGDPYGSIAAIQVVVPKKVQDSSSLPRVRVLTSGPKIREWNSTGTSFDRVASNNPIWILADILTWAGWKADDFNLPVWYAEAAYTRPMVPYVNNLGAAAQHERYKIGFAIRERRSAADILKGLLAGFKCILRQNFTDGKLEPLIKKTLADQQPSPIVGSNNNTVITSALANGTSGAGRAAYALDETNILWRDGKPVFSISQRPINDTPNRLGIPFQNEDFHYTQDTVVKVDSLDVNRSGQEINSSIAAEGITNFDQGMRVIETQFAEEFRGNPRAAALIVAGIPINDTGGTLVIDLETTFKVIHLRCADLIRLSFAAYGINDELFRVLAIQPSSDYETVKLRLQWHEDDWYLDSYGQHPDPLLRSQRRNRMLRSPFGWLPNYAAPQAADPVFDPTEKTFGIGETYQAAADGGAIAQVRVTGYVPVNKFTSTTEPPYAPQATVGGGSIAQGTYYVALCGIDTDGKTTPPSSPLARAVVGAGGGSITLPNIYWNENTVGYRIYAGLNPNLLSKQAESLASTPASITLTAYKASDEAMPDVQLDHFLFRTKRVWHAGVFGATVVSAGASSITIDAGLTTDWSGRHFGIIGKFADTSDVGVLNFQVASSSGATLNVTAGNPAALGIVKGDVLIMYTAPTASTDNTVTDALFQNEVDYFAPLHTIVYVSNPVSGVLPIQIETASQHKMVTGDKVDIEGVEGNTAANGQWTVTVQGPNHFTLDGSAGLSSGDYTSGGTAQQLTNGLTINAEVNRLIRIIAGTGRGQVRRIISNTHTTLTIEGTWDTNPDWTSVLIVEEDAWLDETPGTPIHNSEPDTVMSTLLNLDNYRETTMLVKVFTVDASGQKESIDTDSPERLIFMYGAPGDAVVQHYTATFGIGIGDSAIVDTDVCPHYIVRRRGIALNVEIKAKTAPSSTLTIDIKRSKVVGGVVGLPASIFGATKLVLASGAVGPAEQKVFADPDGTGVFQFEENDILTADVIDSGGSGKDYSVFLKIQVNYDSVNHR